MDENIDYGELFGIEESENTQEAAEPAMDHQEQPQGEKEQETAEPAGEDTQEALNEERDPEEPDAGDGDEKQQSAEENAAYAAIRRKAEAQRDAAVLRAREDAQRAINDIIRNSGMVNPYTGKRITTKDEYDEYKARFESERKAAVLQKSGMSDEEFNAFVDSLPQVQQARDAQRAAEEALHEANEAKARANIAEQLGEISKLNPEIRELKDLAAMDTYPRLYELVKKGNTLSDAYRLANFDKLTQSAANRARQTAISSIQSKRHMGQTTQRGTGATPVPDEVKQMYKMLNPEATDAEIQTHYNKSARRH